LNYTGISIYNVGEKGISEWRNTIATRNEEHMCPLLCAAIGEIAVV
jgi:hypothetical protein